MSNTLIGDYTYDEFLRFCDQIVRGNPLNVVGRQFTPLQHRIVDTLIKEQIISGGHGSGFTLEYWEAYRQVVRCKVQKGPYD